MKSNSVVVAYSLFLIFFTMTATGGGSDIMLYSSEWKPKGIYRGVNQWGVLAIRESDGRQFIADDNNENSSYSHTIRAQMPQGKSAQQGYKFTATNTFNATIKRTNRQNHCVTELYGKISFIGSDEAVWRGESSDGRCDVPMNYSEIVEMKRER